MLISTPYFLVTVITKPEVGDHLIPNIQNFKYVYYTEETIRGSTPGAGRDKEMLRVQILCPRSVYVDVMKYLDEYYVKGYGAVCFQEEVDVPT